MRFFSYKLTHDTGFAPNPFFGYLTLANCKPGIMMCYNKENERMYKNTNEDFDYSYKNEQVSSNENEFIPI